MLNCVVGLKIYIKLSVYKSILDLEVYNVVLEKLDISQLSIEIYKLNLFFKVFKIFI